MLNWLSQPIIRFFALLERTFIHLTRLSRDSIAYSTAADLPRSKSQLIAENALLRQQLIILHRRVKKPRFTRSERFWLVLIASHVQHREGFRLFWKFKSRNRGGRPKSATAARGGSLGYVSRSKRLAPSAALPTDRVSA